MTYDEITELLNKKNDLENRLKAIPFIGTPEIKVIGNKKYLYIRKRVLDKIKSTYISLYNDDLYLALVKSTKEARTLQKSIRDINKKLTVLGYQFSKTPINVQIAIDCARKNRSVIIYDQAVLEGIGTTFPDTEEIIENGHIKNASTKDVQKLLNLKHAWEFILDEDVLNSPTNYYLSSYIAKMVNEGFYNNGGRIRNVPVIIGGSSYIPPIPLEADVIDKMRNIIKQDIDPCDIAIDICLYIMKTQVYNDGNKRTAVIAANHYLISKGIGYLAIDYEKVPLFKKLLVDYYEDKDLVSIKDFLRNCIRKI